MRDTLLPVDVRRRTGPKLKGNGLPGLLPSMAKKSLDDEQLGKLIGRSGRTIQSWRLGEASPQTSDVWRNLAIVLDTTIDFLLTGV